LNFWLVELPELHDDYDAFRVYSNLLNPREFAISMRENDLCMWKLEKGGVKCHCIDKVKTLRRYWIMISPLILPFSQNEINSDNRQNDNNLTDS